MDKTLFLYQEESGFLFNSDAHFLYDFISKFNPKGELLDVGCGCGIVGLLLKRDFNINLCALDIQKHNIFLTEQNARVNDLNVDLINTDYLKYNFDKKFDFIISNPPYYHDGVSKSSNNSLSISRYSSYMPLESFIKKSNQIIKPKGHLVFCYDAKQIQEIFKILTNYKFVVEDIKFIHGTNDKNSSIVLIHAKKGSRSLCSICPPLIHFVDNKLSDKSKDIYQKTRTYSIKCKLLGGEI